jgi:hypothetical protein
MFLYMFFGMIVIHLFIMPFVMIADVSDFRVSLNGIYMAVFAGAAMVVLEALRHPLDTFGWAVTLVLLTASALAIRYQIGVSDAQYLRDMVPHHSMAILTSRPRVDRSQDPEIRALASGILRAQITEIAEMKKLLTK